VSAEPRSEHHAREVDDRAREVRTGGSRTLAPFERRALTVTANESLGAYRVLTVADPDGPEPAAGQFAMLAAVERWGAGEDERPYLPRAFSYARWLAGPRPDRALPQTGYRSPIGGEAQFLLENVGPGTCRLCELREGEQLWVLGPLGNGFTRPEPERRALLVGGGVGIAPLAIWQDALHASDEPTTVLLGFRDGAHAVGGDLLADARLASDDGSVGHHGLVTELLREEIDRDERIAVYACGPPPMLEAVRALCAEHSIPTQLALEAGMACGFGACYGCVVSKRGGGYLRVCVDGPVVDSCKLERVE
jgi:dihydroorotate dehydrogenase electron transfer subunit